MKVLVLGGTGFVGGHVARAFARAGYAVAVGVRPGSSREALADLEPEFVPLDLRDRDSLEAAQAAAMAATAQLDPRQLQDEVATAATPSGTSQTHAAAPEDMRAQIEQLLYALIDR